MRTFVYLTIFCNIFIFLGLFACKAALEINLRTENHTGILDSNSTMLICSYTKTEKERVLTLFLSAENTTTNSMEDIAVFRPNYASMLRSPFGDYLFGRVSLTNITDDSTEARLLFLLLKCLDETEYQCRITYLDSNNIQFTSESNAVKLLIQVLPTKPDAIYINKNSIEEGDNVTFTCKGNLGKPPKTFVWQKRRQSETHHITYNGSTLTTEEENLHLCSFEGTSNITLQLTAQDNKAQLRCFVNTLEEEYEETEPVNVNFMVRNPTVTKYPNQEIYEEGSGLVLICASSGNPQPTYTWEKDDNILAYTNTFEIKDAKMEDGGLYICSVSNSFHGTSYRSSFSVLISIMEKPKTTNAGLANNNAGDNVPLIVGITVGVISVITAILVCGIVMIRRKSLRSNKNSTKNTRPSEVHVIDRSYEKPDGTSAMGHFYQELTENVDSELPHSESCDFVDTEITNKSHYNEIAEIQPKLDQVKHIISQNIKTENTTSTCSQPSQDSSRNSRAPVTIIENDVNQYESVDTSSTLSGLFKEQRETLNECSKDIENIKNDQYINTAL